MNKNKNVCVEKKYTYWQYDQILGKIKSIYSILKWFLKISYLS